MQTKAWITLSDYSAVSDLTDEQFGRLMRALIAYQTKQPVEPAPDIKIAYNFIIIHYQQEQTKRPAGAPKGNKNACKYKDSADNDNSKTIQNNSKQLNSIKNNSSDRKETKKESIPPHPPLKKENKEKKEKLSVESKKNDRDDTVTTEQTASADNRRPYTCFRLWMQHNTPTLYKGIGAKLSENEFERLRSAISGDQLALYAIKLENNREYLRKYRSMYLTLVNWLKRDGYDN